MNIKTTIGRNININVGQILLTSSKVYLCWSYFIQGNNASITNFTVFIAVITFEKSEKEFTLNSFEAM